MCCASITMAGNTYLNTYRFTLTDDHFDIRISVLIRDAKHLRLTRYLFYILFIITVYPNSIPLDLESIRMFVETQTGNRLKHRSGHCSLYCFWLTKIKMLRPNCHEIYIHIATYHVWCINLWLITVDIVVFLKLILEWLLFNHHKRINKISGNDDIYGIQIELE